MDGYLPDLYVSVAYVGLRDDGNFGEEQAFGQTSTIYEDSNPQFDETLIYDKYTQSHEYQIKVDGFFHVSLMDSNRLSDTLLGDFMIDLRKADLINGSLVRQGIKYTSRTTVHSEITYHLLAFMDDGVEAEETVQLIRADEDVVATDPVTEFVTMSPDDEATIIQIIAQDVTSSVLVDSSSSLPVTLRKQAKAKTTRRISNKSLWQSSGGMKASDQPHSNGRSDDD